MSHKDGDDSDGSRTLSGGPDALLHMDRERLEADRSQQQAPKRYQTLLPAAESSPVTRSLTTDPNRKLPPKRKLVLVACSRCRQKKEKVPAPQHHGRDMN
jgi:hypothetical protein